MVSCMDLMRPETYEGLPYRIYIPENYGAAQRYPLVLYLHGMGERGDDNRLHISKNSVMETLLEPEARAAYPCIVLAPQCPESDFWPGLAPALMGLLEHTKAAYAIDPARIYVTGLSMGGFGTWAMLTDYPDYFAAAVPICGGDPEAAPLFRHVPLWAFHGAKDTTVYPDATRGMVAALALAGARDLHYTEYPEAAHNSWDRAYREPGLFPWLFAQAKV
ncbi:MAG: prolyl oligopeptidase family serine peptidase [Firmicutes bacterium]|nr:prolyl oligopeptidase family serine peptidase [Bacillota bacterium]